MVNLFEMKTKRLFFTLITLFFLAACQFSESIKKESDENNNTVEITILQLNDVYEMSPVSGGRLGGLARVSTLLNQLRAENPNTITVLSGDLLSPSAIGTAKFKNSEQKFAGIQMVDILNQMGWDYFTLGNHEFDIGRKDLLARLDSMKFKTIIDNVIDTTTKSLYPNTELRQIVEIEGVKIGLFGVMTDGYDYGFATVSDPLVAAKRAVSNLKNNLGANVILGITHLNISEDVKLVEAIESIDLVMGGHEHENYHRFRGSGFTPITKADANAKSAYVHHLTFNKKTQDLDIISDLVVIDSSFKEDPRIDSLVDYWTTLAFDYFRVKFKGDPEEEIGCPILDLDGSEASVRSMSTNLTKLITEGFYNYYADSTKLKVDGAIMNGGSIRIDDNLPANHPVTLYDVIRISPFGGTISLVSMKGRTLKKALDIGANSKGSGAFLQYHNIQKNESTWEINNLAIKDNENYNIAISSYLVEKGDTGLGILTYDEGKVTALDAPTPNFAEVVKAQFSKTYPCN